MTNQVVRPRIAAKLERTRYEFRKTGVLRTILTLLTRGPCPVAEIVEELRYTRRQVVAALAYGKRRGYVGLSPFRDEGGLPPDSRWSAFDESDLHWWSITPAGLVRLKVLGAARNQL